MIKNFKNILLTSALLVGVLNANQLDDEFNRVAVKKSIIQTIKDNRIAVKKSIIQIIKDNKDLLERVEILEKKLKALEKKPEIIGYSEEIQKEEKIHCLLENCDYIVNKWAASIRDSASLEGKRVKNAKFGTLLIVKKLIDKNWAMLEDGNYINTSCITEAKKVGIKTKRKSNLRNRPYLIKETIIGKVDKNKELISYGLVNQWYVLKNGVLIHSSNIKK